MNRIKTIKSVVIVILGALLLYCSSCRKQENVVKIGAVLPLSGNLAQLGECAQTGLLLAEKYINSSNNKKLKLYFEDGKGNPTSSINATTKLTTLDNVDIIFSIISAVDLSIIPIQEKDGFLMFSHASHPQLSNINKLFFRHSQTVQQEVKFILSNVDSLSTITVCYMKDDYGVAFEKEIQDKAIHNPIKAVIPFMPMEFNFSTIAKKIINSKSDVVIICAGGKNISDLVRKLREQNYQGEIITTLAYVVSGANNLTQDIPNLFMVKFKEIAVEKKLKNFITEYERATEHKIGTTEMMFFNTALLVYMNTINGNSPEQIATEIKKHQTINILGDIVTITSTNDILPELAIMEQ